MTSSNSTQPSASPPPETRVWSWDKIPDYQLNEAIIHDFLREKWGDFEHFIEVIQALLDRL